MFKRFASSTNVYIYTLKVRVSSSSSSRRSVVMRTAADITHGREATARKPYFDTPEAVFSLAPLVPRAPPSPVPLSRDASAANPLPRTASRTFARGIRQTRDPQTCAPRDEWKFGLCAWERVLRRSRFRNSIEQKHTLMVRVKIWLRSRYFFIILHLKWISFKDRFHTFFSFFSFSLPYFYFCTIVFVPDYITLKIN